MNKCKDSLLKNIPEYDLGNKMMYQYDISKYMVKDNENETIFHIPNELNIDYVHNKKVLLSQYKEVEIKYENNQDYHRVICTKYNQ